MLFTGTCFRFKDKQVESKRRKKTQQASSKYNKDMTILRADKINFKIIHIAREKEGHSQMQNSLTKLIDFCKI